MKFIWHVYLILKGKVYLAKMNNLPKHEARAQCSCIGCIGLRPALRTIDKKCQYEVLFTYLLNM